MRQPQVCGPSRPAPSKGRNATLRERNKKVTLLNNIKRNVAEPLATTEAQIKTVRALRGHGSSLRDIAELQ
jgi:hypothetical protein